MVEQTQGKDPYEGLNGDELKAAFWRIIHYIPPPVTQEDVDVAVEHFGQQINNLQGGIPIEENDELVLQKRSAARSQLRQTATRTLYKLLTSKVSSITAPYAEFIAKRRFGKFFHWGITQEQLEDKNGFPAYLVGLEGDTDSLGIFSADPLVGKEIERTDYRELREEALIEYQQRVDFFGQTAMNDFQERVRRGEHPEDPDTELLNRWKRAYMEKHHGEEP